MKVKQTINRMCDTLVTWAARVESEHVSTFRVCGGLGFVANVITVAILAMRSGASPWLAMTHAVNMVITLLSIALLVKLATGEERHVS